MFRKILVAFDGSKQAQKALSHALGMAKASKARLSILYVAEQLPIAPTSATFMLQEELRAMGELEVKKAGFLARKNGVKADLLVEQGHPVDEILKRAKKGGFDLIVMGARGRGGMEKLLLGSVSDSVIHHAHCAVLTVK